MTLTLAATSTVAGSAASAASVNYAIFGDEVTAGGADTFKKLAAGVLGASPATLYTVPAGGGVIIKQVLLHNTTAGALAVAMYVDGTAAANRVVSFTIPANGSATYDGRWTVYDANGYAQTAGAIGPAGVTGARGLNWQGAYSAGATYAVDDAVYYATLGKSYRSLQAGNIGHTPPAGNDAWWYQLNEKGDTGTAGAPGAPGEVPNARMISTTAPLTGGGDLSANRTLAISAATTGAAGSMSAADKVKVDALTGTNSGDVTLTAVGGSPNANGASLSGQVLTLQPASSTQPGLLSAADKRIIDSLHYDMVADFGWVGNDSTDNLSLWATVKSTAPVGAVLFFPAGTYRTSGELTIDVDKRFSFRGVGRYSSVIKTTSTTANIFHKSVAGWYDTWSDLGFQSSVTKTAGSAIHISAGNNVGMNVYKCWINGLFKGISAIGSQSANLSVWADLDISGIPNGGRGLQINGDTINVMIHNATINAGAATTSACCEINQSGAVQVTASDWIQGTNVLWIKSDEASGAGPQACYFTNCFFDQPQGSVIKITGARTANRIKFTQCGIAPTGNNHGIEFNGTGVGAVGTATALPAGVSIVDCDIYSQNGTNTGAGILLNGVGDVNIQNSRITGFGGAGGCGISVIPSAGNMTKLRANGNILGPNSNLTVINETGVKLVAGSSAMGFLSITDNSMIGCTTAISDASTALNTSPKNINNNQGAVSGFGAQAVPLSTVLTTVETVVMVVPLSPNSVKVGTSFKVVLNYKPALASIGTVRFRIGTSDVTPATNTALAATADTVTTANANAKFGTMQGAITVVGASAAFIGNGFFVNTAAVVNHSQNVAASGTFNSAVQNYLMVTIQNGTSTTTTVYSGTIEVISPS